MPKRTVMARTPTGKTVTNAAAWAPANEATVQSAKTETAPR
jgi:hypothetical protein